MAETGAQLGARNGQPFPVLASRGSEAVADEAAERCARAHRDLASLLGSTPHLRVFVLDEADWRRRAMFPLYGMPPYADERTLVIAGEETDFWHAVSPPEAAFPADLPMRMISSPCTSWPASSTHSRAGVPPAVGDGALLQPCLHAYVARAEPERLAALETLPAAVVAVGQRGLAHRTLEDLERLSVGVGPLNYAWHQSHLHAAAKRIFDKAAKTSSLAPGSCFPALTRRRPPTSSRPRERVHPEVARTLTAWPPK